MDAFLKRKPVSNLNTSSQKSAAAAPTESIRTLQDRNRKETSEAQQNAKNEMFANMRGSTSHVMDYFDLVKELDNILPELQQVQFSTPFPFEEGCKLIEIDKKLADQFEKGEELVFRGTNEDYVVLCSSNRTFAVKEVETSNSLVLLPVLKVGQELRREGEHSLDVRYINALSHHFMEMKEMAVVSCGRLKSLMMERELNWDWLDDMEEMENNKFYTREDLLDAVQMSSQQLDNNLLRMPIVEHNGYLRYLSINYRNELVAAIVDICDGDFDGVSIHVLTEKALLTLLSDNVTEEVVRWFLRDFCEPVSGSSEEYRLLPEPIVRNRAMFLLRNVAQMDEATFTRQIDQILPHGIQMSFSMLCGICLLDESFKGRFVVYLAAEDLPEEPRERLKILFEFRPTWTIDQIAPYLQNISPDAKSMSGLLVSLCRSTKNDAGEKVFCALKITREQNWWRSGFSVFYVCQEKDRRHPYGFNFGLEGTSTGGLRGGSAISACVHRNKKALFKTKDVRKKLKVPKLQCEECDRLVKNGKAAPENNSELFICLSCATVGCEEHSRKHAEAPRSGSSHPLLFALEKIIIRCHECDIDVEAVEDLHDPIKLFYDDYRSFVKNRENNSKSSSTKAVVVEGKPEPASSEKVKEKTNGVDAPKKEKKVREREPSMEIMNKEFSLPRLPESLVAAKGLSNLGNTCFFNSVMQCIMHTHHLDFYFDRFGRVAVLSFNEEKTMTVNEEKVILATAKISVPPLSVPLNNVLRNFLAEFRCGSAPSPSPVFSQISRKAPRFKGFQQQDAHELLRYLLDGLRSEELERYREGIAAHFNVSTKTNPKKLDPDVVRKAKGYLQSAGRPLLDSVFGGTLLQTIRCSECGHISERNEQFLDLSIPLSANPMSARNSAGRNGTAASISNHQKKKAAALAKKNALKEARKKRAGDATAKRVSEAEEATEDRLSALATKLEETALSDAEDEEEDESDGDSVRSEAGADPLDYTKVLVSPPAEYSTERSVGACLLDFTAEERLAGPNAYECEKCCSPRNKKMGAKGNQKKRVEALKRYLIFEPPTVLTLQLKRFHQIAAYNGRLSTKKLGGHVNFPLIFDIAPFCCKNVERVAPGQKRILYSLYGVVVHSGDLSGGHYIAYVKSRHRAYKAVSFLESARGSCVDALAAAVDKSVATIDNEGTPDISDGQWYYCSDSRVNAVQESRVLAAEAYLLFYERVM